MSFQLSASLLLVVLSAVFGVLSHYAHASMVEAINTKLPANRQFGKFRWGGSNGVSIHREYRHHYPDGKLLRGAGILTSLSHLCLILFAELIGFPLFMTVAYGVLGFLFIWLSYIKLVRPYC